MGVPAGVHDTTAGMQGVRETLSLPLTQPPAPLQMTRLAFELNAGNGVASDAVTASGAMADRREGSRVPWLEHPPPTNPTPATISTHRGRGKHAPVSMRAPSQSHPHQHPSSHLPQRQEAQREWEQQDKEEEKEEERRRQQQQWQQDGPHGVTHGVTPPANSQEPRPPSRTTEERLTMVPRRVVGVGAKWTPFERPAERRRAEEEGIYSGHSVRGGVATRAAAARGVNFDDNAPQPHFPPQRQYSGGVEARAPPLRAPVANGNSGGVEARAPPSRALVANGKRAERSVGERFGFPQF